MGEYDQRLAGLRGETVSPVTAEPKRQASGSAASNGGDESDDAVEAPQLQRRLDALRASGPGPER